MDVIDRYFRTLRVLLPRDQRDDIIRELSEEVQLTDRREGSRARAIAGAGRTSGDHRAVRPSVADSCTVPAAAISDRTRASSRITGSCCGLRSGSSRSGTSSAPSSSSSVAAIAAQWSQLVEQAIATALKVAAWITALAAIADCLRSRALAYWRRGIPRDVGAASLPQQRVERQSVCQMCPERITSSPPGHPSRLSPSDRAFRIARFVIGLVVGVWWLAGLRFPSLFFGPGAAGLAWGPAMDRLYPGPASSPN